MLTIIKRAGSDKHKKKLWLCECSCGNQVTVTTEELHKGQKSCGCIRKRGNPKHGLRHHPLYSVLACMIDRCSNPKNKSHPYYKHVSVYRRWTLRSPKIFIDWAIKNGWKAGMDIHRKNNRLNYSPKNCVFVLHSQHSTITNNERWGNT